jgi:hypothetical protein
MRSEVGYERHKDRALDRRREETKSSQEIGPPPPVENPERKAACGESLKLFCETYYPTKFRLAWSPDHIKVIGKLEQCVRHHGLFALAMDRGSGKTELSTRAAEWGILYGYRRFVILVGAAEDKADQLMADVKASFEINDLLAADFPEACFPIRKLEGETRRCVGQRCMGERTKIIWKQGEIRLPMVPGSVCAGAVIRTEGLTGSIRGAKAVTPDGGSMRPDLAILDDPQTRKSAGSPALTEEREQIVRGDILGLAGPDRSISCIMPCTVIFPGDLADRMLDRDRNPQWNGERMKRVYEFPKNQALWDEFANERAVGLRAGDNGAMGNAFYAKNQEAMDEGCVLGWPERYDRTKYVSAIQEAMVRKIDDPEAFAAECQNEPLPLNPEASSGLDAGELGERATNLPRGVVPYECSRLTAFIDVGKHLLWYMVVAWDERFGGSVIDYGPYPKQTRSYFSAGEPRPAMDELPGMVGKPAKAVVYAGLTAVAEQILGAGYRQEESGDEFRVERCLVDANWGELTEVVYDFCRRSPFAEKLLPSHGKFYGASSQPMVPKPDDERRGPGWARKRAGSGAARGRHIVFDSNYWKSFVADRLRTDRGSPGCLLFHAPGRGGHQLLADHLTAEYPVTVEQKGGGRVVDEWKDKPNRDNHLWDTLVGATLAASIAGLRWDAGTVVGQPPLPRPARKSRSLTKAMAKRGGPKVIDTGELR